jgi:hypothetical protein
MGEQGQGSGGAVFAAVAISAIDEMDYFVEREIRRSVEFRSR